MALGPLRLGHARDRYDAPAYGIRFSKNYLKSPQISAKASSCFGTEGCEGVPQISCVFNIAEDGASRDGRGGIDDKDDDAVAGGGEPRDKEPKVEDTLGSGAVANEVKRSSFTAGWGEADGLENKLRISSLARFDCAFLDTGAVFFDDASSQSSSNRLFFVSAVDFGAVAGTGATWGDGFDSGVSLSPNKSRSAPEPGFDVEEACV